MAPFPLQHTMPELLKAKVNQVRLLNLHYLYRLKKLALLGAEF